MVITNGAKARASIVFVLGMHRSGTSALSRTLNLAGLRMPKEILGANQDNPRGYWEPKSVVEFNQRLLMHFDRHWADPKPLPAGWEHQDVPGLGPQDAVALLRDEIDTAVGPNPVAAVVIKDPRLSRTMPLWRKAARLCDVDTASLIMCRNPYDVFKSLEKREKVSRDHALQLWLTYMLEAEAGTRGMRRAIISYDELLENWRTTLHRAWDEIDWPDREGIEKNARVIDAHLDTSHRHHHTGKIDFPDRTSLEVDVMTALHLSSKTLTPDTRAEFDRLQQRSIDGWLLRSPKQDGSHYPQEMPGWYAEKSHALLAQGNLEEAIVAATEAISLAPGIMRFHFILGNLLIKADRLEAGVASLKTAIEIDDSQSRIHRSLANALDRLGDTDGAIAAMKGAIGKSGHVAQDHHNLGNLLVKSGRFAEAIVPLTQAIELDKSKANYHRVLSQTLARLGQTEAAIDPARRAAELNPGQAAYAYDLGSLCAQAGFPDDAVAALARAVALNEKPMHFHTALVNALIKHGDVSGAIKALQRIADRDSFHAGLLDRLGQLLAQENRWAEAEQAYNKALYRRGQIFGFRAQAAEKAAHTITEEAGQKKRTELRMMLARLSTQYWAEDLCQLVRTRQEGSVSEEEWPIGRKLPNRQNTVLPARTDKRPDKTLSVMLPVYEVEREDWLREALNGVLAQDQGPDWAEIVIIDDASISQVAKRVAESYGARVRYVRNTENLGLVANHNRCLSEAKGEFVHILHQDDRVKPGFYQALLTPMQNDDRIVAGFSQTGYISERSGSEGVEEPLQQMGMLESWHVKLSLYRIQFPTIIVRRSTYDAVGGFSPSLRFAFDWDMWNRVSASGPVWYTPQPLAQYRVHSGSATFDFTMTERVIDAMKVVAHMLRLLPQHQHRATAELAIYKFFFRYWTLITQEPLNSKSKDRQELIKFLTGGWTRPDEVKRVREMLEEI